MTGRALEILNEWDTTRQFLWVHYFDAHEPYGDRGGKVVRLHQLLSVIRRRPDAVRLALQQAREAYERDLAAMDRSLDRLWQRLQSDMSVIETHVIVATDHGESFGERGSIGHGHRVSPEIVHVPFFIVSPAFPPKLRQDATGSVDVFNTLLGLARIQDPSGQGRDLSDTRGDEFGLALGLSRDVPEPYRDIRTDGSLPLIDRARFFLARGGSIYEGDVEHPAPPGTDEALALELSDRFQAIQQRLDGVETEALIDPETRKAFEALGYGD